MSGEAGAAPIPAPRDGAEYVGGAAPGPSCREAPDIRRCSEAGPSRGRRRYLPHELRKELYDEVLRLYGEGLGCRRIIRELRKRYGVAPSRSTISYWIRGLHTPYGRASGSEPPAASARRPTQKISLEPNPELAYVIGAVLGNGYVCSDTDHRKIIGLKAKDEEFVREFARCLTEALGRENPLKVRFWKARKLFKAKAGSATLYRLLHKQDPNLLDRLRPFIEHCEECMTAFLRGFVDSEGCVDKYGFINIYNTNFGVLSYVKELLDRLGIEATGPHLIYRAGTPLFDPRTGKMYVKRRDYYVLRTRARSAHVFYQKIGLTITRKRRRLEEYLKRKPLPPNSLTLFTARGAANRVYKGPRLLCGAGSG